jgi:hypothetical protein
VDAHGPLTRLRRKRRVAIGRGQDGNDESEGRENTDNAKGAPHAPTISPGTARRHASRAGGIE